MSIPATTGYPADVLHLATEGKMWGEEDRLFSRFLLGRLYSWKAKPNYILCHRGQWRQMYETLTDISLQISQADRIVRGPVVLRSIQRPSFSFTPEAIDKAFGEGAWEALNEAIAVI